MGPFSPGGRSLERYWMPELPTSIRYFSVSSKSPTVPSFQTRNVLCLSFVSPSLPVLPVIAPSCTDHNFGLPSQPLRSLPLKSFLSSAAATVQRARKARNDGDVCMAAQK